HLGCADGQPISTDDMEIYMKLLIPSIAALPLPATSLSAGAALKPSDFLGERAQAPSPARAIVTAVADRTITITGDTKWANVNHYEVVRFAAHGSEFTWYFDGMAPPRPFDLSEIAPAGFVNHRVTVYVKPTDRRLP